MAVSDRMVLLVRALAVFAVNAGSGWCAPRGVGDGRGVVTFGWLIPMAALCALALAVAAPRGRLTPAPRRASPPGCITVLAGGYGRRKVHRSGHRRRRPPSLPGRRACAVAIAVYATRTPRGTS